MWGVKNREKDWKGKKILGNHSGGVGGRKVFSGG